MKFRTEIEFSNHKNKIEYFDKLFFIGSCFADNIGSECCRHGIKTMINPFGVTYNPLSLITILKHIEERKAVDDSMYRKVGEVWCSLLHHSSFDASSLDEVKENTMCATNKAHDYLKSASHLLITFGTAWVYVDNRTVNVVNNCHKIPDKEFTRRKLSVSEIVDNFSEFIDNSWLLTDKKIIFTVSPIRHLKDTIVGNSFSKATLITAIGELCEKYPDRVTYFPSYEIMVDDLRDYRFYEADMLHPNDVAIQYIYSIFEKDFFTAETIEYCQMMSKIENGKSHKVINKDSETYKKFKQLMISKLLSVKQKYPFGDYDELFNFFR